MPLASGAAARTNDRNSGRLKKDRAHRDTVHTWADEPMYVEAPFTIRMPTNCFMSLCCVCMVPKVRGIPTGAQQLPDEEVQEVLDRIQGHWLIQHPILDGSGHTDADIDGSELARSFTKSGTTKRQRKELGVTQSLSIMHRDVAGNLYIDLFGSLIEQPFNPEQGSFVMMPAVAETRQLYQRKWKKLGLAGPPDQDSSDEEDNEDNDGEHSQSDQWTAPGDRRSRPPGLNQ